MRGLSLAACLLMWAVSLHAQDASKGDASTPSWGPAPAVFPAGAKMAVISGDPAKAALFTVELSFPDDYRIPPHSHPAFPPLPRTNRPTVSRRCSPNRTSAPR